MGLSWPSLRVKLHGPRLVLGRIVGLKVLWLVVCPGGCRSRLALQGSSRALQCCLESYSDLAVDSGIEVRCHWRDSRLWDTLQFQPTPNTGQLKTMRWSPVPKIVSASSLRDEPMSRPCPWNRPQSLASLAQSFQWNMITSASYP